MDNREGLRIAGRIAILWTFGAGVTLASAGILGLAVRLFAWAAWGG